MNNLFKNLQQYIHLYMYCYPKFATPYTILTHLFYINGNASNDEAELFGMDFYVNDDHIDVIGKKYVNFVFSNFEKTNNNALGEDFLKVYNDVILPFIAKEKPQYLNMDIADENFWINEIALEFAKGISSVYARHSPVEMVNLGFPYISERHKTMDETSRFYVPIYDHIRFCNNELEQCCLYDFVGFFGEIIIDQYIKLVDETEMRIELKDEMNKRLVNFKLLKDEFKYKEKKEW